MEINNTRENRIKYSVITTVYNDENSITEFLEEFMMQSYLPEEIVIADGGSQDRTPDLIRKFRNHTNISIKLVEGERLNIPQGFNTAIKSSNNEMIIIAAIGNSYPSNFCEELIKAFDEDHSLDAVYCPILGKNTTKFSKIYNKAFIDNKTILNIPSNHGVLVKKSAIEELGFFYENLIYAGEDFEFFQCFVKRKKTKCIKTTNVLWETPGTFVDFKKQVRYYLIGNMQIYNNFLLFHKILNKRIIYIFMHLLNVFFLLKKGFNSISSFLSILLLFVNYKWVRECGLDGCFLKNIRIGLEIIYLLKEKKYLLSKNKISSDRILKQVV